MQPTKTPKQKVPSSEVTYPVTKAPMKRGNSLKSTSHSTKTPMLKVIEDESTNVSWMIPVIVVLALLSLALLYWLSKRKKEYTTKGEQIVDFEES